MEAECTGAKASKSSFRKWPMLWPMLISSAGEESYHTEDEQVTVDDTISSPRGVETLEKVALPRHLPSIVEIKKVTLIRLSMYFVLILSCSLCHGAFDSSECEALGERFC